MAIFSQDYISLRNQISDNGFPRKKGTYARVTIIEIGSGL